MVSLKSAKEAVAKARETVDTAMRIGIGALVVAVLAVVLSLVALAKVRQAA